MLSSCMPKFVYSERFGQNQHFLMIIIVQKPTTNKPFYGYDYDNQFRLVWIRWIEDYSTDLLLLKELYFVIMRSTF